MIENMPLPVMIVISIIAIVLAILGFIAVIQLVVWVIAEGVAKGILKAKCQDALMAHYAQKKP
jgi:uncharacterized membrane protein